MSRHPSADIRLKWRAFVVPAGLILVAEAIARATNLQSDSLAAPSQIAIAGVHALLDGTLLRASLDTLWMAFLGVALGGAVGLSAGILLGLVQTADRLMEFSIEAVRPMPSVALIPVGLLAFGFGYQMEIAIIAFATTWPMLILSRSAVSSIEARLLEVARALGFSLIKRVWKIVLPAALPRIFVALRLSIGIALVVAVTVEIAANPLGLGHALMAAQQSLRPALMFATLAWIGLIGWMFNALLVWAQFWLFGPAAKTLDVQP
jgi:ABC-type nitrate/sulfonate/bicarbonate transport system permease component